MKTKFKLSKTAKNVYLHSDGHAIVIHEKEDKQAGRIEWAEVWENIGPKCHFTGRIIFSNLHWYCTFETIAQAESIRCDKPSTDNGSENTKKMGLEVSTLIAVMHSGKSLHWTIFQNFISSDICNQCTPANEQTFENTIDGMFYHGLRISAVHRKEVPATAQAAQAA